MQLLVVAAAAAPCEDHGFHGQIKYVDVLWVLLDDMFHCLRGGVKLLQFILLA